MTGVGLVVAAADELLEVLLQAASSSAAAAAVAARATEERFNMLSLFLIGLPLIFSYFFADECSSPLSAACADAQLAGDSPTVFLTCDFLLASTVTHPPSLLIPIACSASAFQLLSTATYLCSWAEDRQT
ncbi:MAG TPA: hypothetical protein VMV52_05940 [Candidatus Nanopelagicaceae bacterium]|nr:hypothetical protein [Candidatus Nanopelagicaceae bacterium]